MNRALEGSILKLHIQRAFFLTFLSTIVAIEFLEAIVEGFKLTEYYLRLFHSGGH